MKTPVKFGVEIEGYIHGAGGERAASILLDAMWERGIQTEVDWDTGADYMNAWKITGDGSLSYGGIELVSPPLDDLDILEKVFHILEEVGFYTDDQCGLHIHVDRTDTSSYKLWQLSQFMAQYGEDIIMEIIPPDRRDNNWCKKMSNVFKSVANIHYNLAELLDYKDELMSLLKTAYYESAFPDWEEKYNQARYRGFNLHSYWYRGTIEFRYFPGCDNFEIAAAYIELLTKMVNYIDIEDVIHANNLRELVDVLDLERANILIALSEKYKEDGRDAECVVYSE